MDTSHPTRDLLILDRILAKRRGTNGAKRPRAPLGTIFREDCGEDVEVRPTEVWDFR